MKTGASTINMTMTGAKACVVPMGPAKRMKPYVRKIAAKMTSDFVRANMPGFYHGLRENSRGIYQPPGADRVVSLCDAAPSHVYRIAVRG